MKLTKCPDCKGNLEEGAVMDFRYGAVGIERYGKTEVPREQVFHLLSEADFKDIRRVITYRCLECNRLFPYAQDIVLGKNVFQASKKVNKPVYIFLAIYLILIIGFVIFLIVSPK